MGINNIFDRFNKLKALVIGDVMIDGYILGDVNRISPEAPVPVLDVKSTDDRLGGAANVVLNLKSLGATPIMCSVIGDDNNGKKLFDLFHKDGLSTEGMVVSKDRRTTIKTRVIANHQQMLRVDEEDSYALSLEEENTLLKTIKDIINSNDIDVIIFEDYNKGVLTKKVISSIIDIANKQNIPTTVDPKKDNFFEYKNVTLFKPNLKELKEGLNLKIDYSSNKSIIDAIRVLESKLNNKLSLVTLSERGVVITDKTNQYLIPAHIRNIADVSGAGDTVISVASLCLALGIDLDKIAEISNLAGGLVCEEVGVVPINKGLLERETHEKNII